MKCLLIFIPTFLFCNSAFSQDVTHQKEIDSLLIIAKSTTIDTLKINSYQKICDQYSKIDNGKIDYYNKQILELSTKIHYQTGIGFYYYNRVAINNNNSDYKKAMENGIKAVEFFSKSKKNSYYFLSCYYLAYSYMDNLKFEKAKTLLNNAIYNCLNSKNNAMLTKLYGLLGYVYYNNDEFQKSLLNYKKAQFYFEKENSDSVGKASLYLNMSFLYHDLNQFEKALEYLDLALNSTSIEVSKHVICIEKISVLNDMNQPNKAIALGLENDSFFVEQKLQNSGHYLSNLLFLSEAYLKTKKYEIVIKNLTLVKKNTTDFEILITIYIDLSKAYFELNNIPQAKNYADKALALLDTSPKLKAKSEIFLVNYNAEKALGNYQKALLFDEKYVRTLLENNAKISKERILELQTDFGVTEKESKIKSMQVATLQKNAQIDEQKKYLVYGASLLAIALLSILAFIKVYRTIKKKNNLINTKNSALEFANQEVEKSLIIKETLLKEIHHRVKNNLQLVMSLLYIQSKAKGTNMEDFLETSQSRIIAMALIHENLYQTDDLSKVDFKEYTNSLIQSIITSHNNLEQDIQVNVEINDVYLDIQTAIPLGLIINELISNAYKHAFVNYKKGIITLQLAQTDKNFELVVKDDGVGMSRKVTTKKSLGLELVHQLVSQINGILQIKDVMRMHYKIQFQNVTL